jgi:transposase
MQPTYEQLFSQNQALIQQNQALTLQVQTLTQQLNEALAEIQTLRAEVKDLKEKLNTNSSNSSKPPSQDPFRNRKAKKPTGGKQGAQKGHLGHARGLVPIEQVQIQHDLRPGVCPSCQSNNFDPEVIRTEIRQVVELPEIPPEVTQYNIHTYRCSCCGRHVKANIPNEARFGFGPRLMGLVTSLSGEFRLSKRQVTALMGKIGIRICSGSVCKIHARACIILRQPHEDIKKYTLEQEHLNADETSWRTLSTRRWLWTGCGSDSVFFEIRASRSAAAFQEVFGIFKGGLTTDRYGAYNLHEGSRQLCWSHADRDFEKIAGREGFDGWVGKQLLRCKSVVFDLWHSFKAGLIQRDVLISRIEAGPKEDMKVVLKAGAAHEDCNGKTKATCGDFYNRFDMLWVFVYKENVEPTNNMAERSLRFGVIWRKLSYGSQSETGERFVERVMTVAMTLKLRAKNTFEYFTECFREYIRGGHSPPIFSV